MQKDYTHIVVIIDRSGSMESIRSDAEGGINSLIREQKKQKGRATLSLIQFDSDNPYEPIYDKINIQDAKEYKLVPRSSTPLYDCLGRAINETGDYLSKMKEEDRPGLVLFVIATDGEENASKEFKQQQIAEMIKHQQDVYSWSFNYIGANQDAITVGRTLGLMAGKSATYSPNNTHSAYTNTSSKLSCMRGMVASGMACAQAISSPQALYSADDQAALISPSNNVGNANPGLGMTMTGAILKANPAPLSQNQPVSSNTNP